MKILIIGYGSIGKRHAANAKNAGHEAVLLRHTKSSPNPEGFQEYYTLEQALAGGTIDGAIVCSPTSRHLDNVAALVKNKIPFLLEKPPAADLSSAVKMERLLAKNAFTRYDIGFNMRYYPPLTFIKSFLPELGKIYAARIIAGYYLPNWRKGVDYRQSSSASKELGGGVHIELVHEIDYLVWFFGLPERASGYINRVSDLEVSSDDICAALLKYQDGRVVELHLDYLSHKYLRGCQIVAAKGTLEWDMNTGKVLYTEKGRTDAREVFSLGKDYNFNDTYNAELNNFVGIIEGKTASKVSIRDAVAAMKVLEAIERASEKKAWVNLKDI